MTMREKFEGRDLEPQVQAAMEELRREQWKASRAPFQRQGTATALSMTTTTKSLTLASSTSSDVERIKRVQVKALVPTNASSVAGWLGFVRLPEGMNPDYQDLDFGSPAVLRPILWQSNSDHATYWDVYLPAVNLADNGKLFLVGATFSGSHGLVFTARWVNERGLEG